jgi:outer membrane protein assembly factor BamB
MTLTIRCVALGLMAISVADGHALADEPESSADQSAVVGQLTQRWETQAILNVQRDNVRHIVHDESVVLIQSTAGIVTAMNSENGRRLWARQVGRNDAVTLPAGTSSQYALILTGPVAYAMEKFTGDEVFAYRLPRQPSVGAVVAEGSFFVPFIDGSLGGFSFATLQHQEKYGALPAGVPKAMAWRFAANEEIKVRPATGPGIVVFATEKGNIHGLHAGGSNGGHSLYQLLTKHRIVVPLAVAKTPDDDFLLFATSNDDVTCVKLFNGRTMWTYPMGRAIEDNLVVVGDDVYVITEGEGISKLSLSEGRAGTTPRGPWYVADIESIAAVSATRVYGVDNTMQLVVIDRETAAVVSRISLGEDTRVLSNPLTDRVYLYSMSGRVRCFAEAGSEFATYHQHPEQQPVMPNVPDVDPLDDTDNGN